MVAKKRTKKQTLREFRAWLEGVEELQPDNWCPNVNQWKLIRDKIHGIKEEKEIVEKTIMNNTTQQPLNPANTYNAPVPMQQGFAPAPLPTGVPAGQVTVAPTANPMFNSDGGKTKTPDIDTSDGNVTSSFA